MFRHFYPLSCVNLYFKGFIIFQRNRGYRKVFVLRMQNLEGKGLLELILLEKGFHDCFGSVVNSLSRHDNVHWVLLAIKNFNWMTDLIPNEVPWNEILGKVWFVLALLLFLHFVFDCFEAFFDTNGVFPTEIDINFIEDIDFNCLFSFVTTH